MDGLELMQQLNRQVVEIDDQDTHSLLLQSIGELSLHLRHRDRFVGRIRADKEWHLVAQPLHFQEALTADQFQQMGKAFLCCQAVGIAGHWVHRITSSSVTGNTAK